jgi:D-sedoheptulose 7-phosphate isomerase
MNESIKSYVTLYFQESSKICETLDYESISQTVELLRKTKSNKGRIFFAGVGGSAANASHAVNDFRKIGKIESHSLVENVAELTARINDDGWDTSLVETLRTFNPTRNDVLFVLSVGGGSQTTSLNLVRLMEYCKQSEMKICSIVSRDGGQAKKMSDVCMLVPVLSSERITPHAEGFQAVIWHCIVNRICE